ncbi:hydroxyisourate hydrolase [Catenulispora sp. NF23]|nr:hydroxyisourate hydrolase [Catenulispora pinistramenti]MBS2532742.1 hydroxyisourate hydrolase [Catenulispora pinistramenti]
MAISVHICDGAMCTPAADLGVRLRRRIENCPDESYEGRTDSNGFLRFVVEPASWSRLYQIEADLAAYYVIAGVIPSLTAASVELSVMGSSEPLHLSLLISPSSFIVYTANLVPRPD